MEEMKSSEYQAMNAESEYKLQCKVAQYLDSLKVLWTASCGGMRTSIGTATKMKRSGYKKGCPDVLIFEQKWDKFDNFIYGGLFIELKTKKGKVSDEQNLFLNRLMDRDYYAIVCYGYDMTIEEINKYLGV